MTGPVLSIIIVHYNTEELLAQCLRTVYEYPCAPSFEVLIADNGSDAAKMEGVYKGFRPARFLSMDSNVGFSRGINAGIAESRGEFILLLNPDVQLLPRSVDRMIDYLRKHPEAGVVGPKHLSPGDRIQITWGRFPRLATEVVRKAMHEVRNGNIAGRYIEQFAQGLQQVD